MYGNNNEKEEIMIYYYMYEIKNTINNKIYVGVHKTDDMDDGYMGSGKSIMTAIKKYGIDNFTKIILEVFDNEEQMYSREKNYVDLEFVERRDTYNLTVGGSGGSILQNRKSWPKGKLHSKETKEKIRMSSMGRVHSDETLEKMSSNNWSKRNPEEQRLHAIQAGKKRWEKYHESIDLMEETKQKISQSLKRTNKEREGEHPLVGIKRSKVKCPHCDKEGAMNVMSRFHFENCKFRND